MKLSTLLTLLLASTLATEAAAQRNSININIRPGLVYSSGLDSSVGRLVAVGLLLETNPNIIFPNNGFSPKQKCELCNLYCGNEFSESDNKVSYSRLK